MTTKEKVNAKGLLRHAYDVMMLLKNNEIEVDDAKAHANLLKQANNILKYELDRAIAVQKYEAITIRNIEDAE